VRIEWIHCNEESSGNKVLHYHYRKYSRSITRVVFKYLRNFSLQIVFLSVYNVKLSPRGRNPAQGESVQDVDREPAP